MFEPLALLEVQRKYVFLIYNRSAPVSIEEKLKAIKPILKDKYSVERIGYFGSFARGDYREGSDIDIIVSFSGSVGWKFLT
jgi:predicted nucleotidyltransferase